MNLLYAELSTKLTQQIQVGQDNLNLVAIRPHLYRANSPAGSLQIQVEDASGNPMALSETIAISAMPAGNYWHGYLRFMINVALKKNTAYRITLVASGGYSFAAGALIGWCKDFDLRKVPATYAPNLGVSSAFDMELWANQNALAGGWTW